MLHRGEGVDLLSHRQDHDSSRVLSRSPAHTYAALDDAVDLAVALPVSPLLIIIFYIAVSGLVGQGSDGSRPEGLPFSEYDLRVVVSMALVLSGKV